jgi:DNA mismatch repair protein MSH4
LNASHAPFTGWISTFCPRLQLTQQDAETDVGRAERRVTQMLSMRQVVRSLIALCSAVDGVQSELLSKIHAILMDERLEIIDQVVGFWPPTLCCACADGRPLPQLIADRLEEDTGQPDRKKTGLAQRNAKIWAVKASHSRLLDVARETYKENIQDIIELVQGYQSRSFAPLSEVLSLTHAPLCSLSGSQPA